MPDRLQKLNELLREEVASAIAREIELPKGTLVTVTQADVSPTVEHVRIWISVFPAERSEEILGLLMANIRSLQDQLNARLVLRTVPKINLKLDTHEARAEEVEGLLDTLKEDT